MFFMLIENYDDLLKVEQLYNDYRYLMFVKANDILHNESLAEDVVQESFIRVIKNLHKTDENNCPRTRNFLVIICENIAKNIYKKNKRLVSFGEEFDKEDAEGMGDSLDFVIDNESYHRLLDKIDSLPSVARDVIHMKAAYNCSPSEIADLLDIPLETVKKRLYRARKMLSEYLRKEVEKIER